MIEPPAETTSGSTGQVDTSTGFPSDTTGPGPDSSSGTEGATDTMEINCEDLPAPPLTATAVFEPGSVFDGSEDIAFDGAGGLAGKNAGRVLVVDSNGDELEELNDAGPAYGLRYRANGDLLVAKFQLGEIRIVDGAALVSDLNVPNGLGPDLDDNVWFTDGTTLQRLNADDSVDVLVTGGDASGTNGVVYDPDRSMVFYTRYGAGQVRSLVINGDGTTGANELVVPIGGALLDGVSLDACGNLYVVDQGNSALYRVLLDEDGVAVGDAELLVESFPANVANAVFGSGAGWDPQSLYAAGVPGGVYRVEVGVPGAAYPTP